MRVEYAHHRKIRERNKVYYRVAHLPIWIWVFFLAPGPWTFELFAQGFSRTHLLWLVAVLLGTALAGFAGQLPGVEPRPYILRFCEDRPNPLYRRICYSFAWNALINFAVLNATGLWQAAATGRWELKQIYAHFYLPVLLLVLILGAFGILPRAGRSTKGEGIERRFFYAAVWAVTSSQTILLVLWKSLPRTHKADAIKLTVYLVVFGSVWTAAMLGVLPRTRPILPGELIVAD